MPGRTLSVRAGASLQGGFAHVSRNSYLFRDQKGSRSEMTTNCKISAIIQLCIMIVMIGNKFRANVLSAKSLTSCVTYVHQGFVSKQHTVAGSIYRIYRARFCRSSCGQGWFCRLSHSRHLLARECGLGRSLPMRSVLVRWVQRTFIIFGSTGTC